MQVGSPRSQRSRSRQICVFLCRREDVAASIQKFRRGKLRAVSLWCRRSPYTSSQAGCVRYHKRRYRCLWQIWSADVRVFPFVGGPKRTMFDLILRNATSLPVVTACSSSCRSSRYAASLGRPSCRLAARAPKLATVRVCRQQVVRTCLRQHQPLHRALFRGQL